MENVITKIRTRGIDTSSTDCIYEVLLDNGDIILVSTVIEYISLGIEFYFRDHLGQFFLVSDSHPIYKDSYICSESVYEEVDSLLLLPTF